ncbi:MAG: histidine--tRNA ligase [Acidobacteriota bacterium]|nr:histidine--tRNA ligase [Acidobacteriota bacterium]
MYSFETHDLPDLAIARSDILLRDPSVEHPSSISDYQDRLRVLYAALQHSFLTGAAPRTPQNQHAINHLGALERAVKELTLRLSVESRLVPGSQVPPEPNASRLRNELKGLVHDVHYALSQIRLGDVITLRPEATASVVRAYIEHGMQMLPGLVKLYYAGPMFRRERPQKGRYRQFYQIGAEVLGQTDHPAIDAELIEMLTVLLERCKLENWTLLVNSIGDTNCRPAYVALLREELQKVKDQLGPDSQRRIETNPLRVLDSKLPEEQPIIAKLPMISDHLCEPCREHFAELRRQLDLRSIPYKVEPRLVRGLDYYMRTTFEITSPHLGAQNALAGGGRYDGLSEMLGGPPAKGIGFALGQDRFIEVIQTAGRIDATRALDAFIVWMGAAAYPAAVRLARRLRQEGLCVEVPAEEPKLRKALGLAERLGARFAVIIGENEVQSGEFTVKRFADGEQRKLAEAEVAAFVKAPAQAARESESKSEPAD